MRKQPLTAQQPTNNGPFRKKIAIKTGGLLLAAILFSSGCSDGGSSGAGNALTYLKSSQSYLEQHQYKAAMIEARNAIRLAPEDGDGHVLVAKIYNELGQAKRALDELSKIDSDKNIEYYDTLIQAYLKRGKYKSALNTLTEQNELFADKQVEFLIYQGTAYAGLFEYRQAESSLEQAIKLAPDDVDIKILFSRIFAQKGDIEQANSWANQAIETDSNNAEALVLLSRYHYLAGNINQAEQKLTDALSLQPATDVITPLRASTLRSLSEILTRQGRSAEAMVYAKLLAESQPGAQEVQEQYQQAIDLYSEGNLEEARNRLLTILEQLPGNEAATTLLGVINYLQGDIQEAEQLLADNFDPETASSTVKSVYAMTQIKLNRSKEVLTLLKDDIANTKNADILGLYGIAALSNGKTKEGIAALNKALKLDPNKARLSLLVARHLNSEAKQEQALTVLTKAKQNQPEDPYVQAAYLRQLLALQKNHAASDYIAHLLKEYSGKASSYLIAGDYFGISQDYVNSAINFSKAIELAPDDTRGYSGLAKTSIQQQEWEKARIAFRKIIELQPSHRLAYQGLLHTYVATGNPEKGLAELKELATNLNSVTPIFVLSEYYASLQNTDEAQKYLELAKNKAPESAQTKRLIASINFLKARNALAQEDYIAARQSLLVALEAEPDNPRVMGLLVETEIRAKQFNEASKIIQRIRESHPNLNLADLLAGDLAIVQQDPEKAASLYSNAWSASASDLAGAKTYLALIRSNNSTDAERFLFEWVEKLPESSQAKLNLASHLQSKGVDDKAALLFEKVLKIEPNSPVALNNLAWIYFTKGDDRALNTARKAYEIAPENGAIADTYGWILYKQGEREKAIPILEKAAKLDPDNSTILDHFNEVSSNR